MNHTDSLFCRGRWAAPPLAALLLSAALGAPARAQEPNQATSPEAAARAQAMVREFLSSQFFHRFCQMGKGNVVLCDAQKIAASLPTPHATPRATESAPPPASSASAAAHDLPGTLKDGHCDHSQVSTLEANFPTIGTTIADINPVLMDVTAPAEAANKPTTQGAGLIAVTLPDVNGADHQGSNPNDPPDPGAPGALYLSTTDDGHTFQAYEEGFSMANSAHSHIFTGPSTTIAQLPFQNFSNLPYQLQNTQVSFLSDGLYAGKADGGVTTAAFGNLGGLVKVPLVNASNWALATSAGISGDLTNRGYKTGLGNGSSYYFEVSGNRDFGHFTAMASVTQNFDRHGTLTTNPDFAVSYNVSSKMAVSVGDLIAFQTRHPKHIDNAIELIIQHQIADSKFYWSAGVDIATNHFKDNGINSMFEITYQP